MNSVTHFEIPADDVGRAKKFYADVFGWTSQDVSSVGDFEYHMLMTTETDEKMMPKKTGAINGGLFPREGSEKSMVVIDVPDIKDHVEKIKSAGGKITQDVAEVGDMGWYARFVDTEGNDVGIWQSK